MLLVSSVVAILAAAAFGLVLLNVLTWPRVEPRGKRFFGTVSLLIPARNEEANIAECLQTALDQNLHEILVCDDHSTDGTARILAEYAPRVRSVEATPLPAGWSGKTHACQIMARQAEGDWLLFIDADARLYPGAVERMLAQAQELGVTFLSCWPQLEMRSAAERLLMPLLNFVVFTLFPAPLQLRRNDPGLGVGHGACILMRKEEYFAVGGHAAVKAELFEDTRLARIWREHGFRGACLDGTGTVRVRMYESFAAVFNGFQKIVFPAFKGQAGFWAFWSFHGLIFWLPFLLWWPGIVAAPAGYVFGAAALCVVAARLALAIRFRHPLWSALLHPVGQAVFLASGLTSWGRVFFGRGIPWKGRLYYSAAARQGQGQEQGEES